MAKRKDTFKGYQKAEQEMRKQCITEELVKLKVDKAKFETITHLARRLVDMIYQRRMIEFHKGALVRPPKKTSVSTLLRNDIYKVLLVSYQSGNFNTDGTILVKKTEIQLLRKTYPGLDAYISSMELKITRLEAQSNGALNFDAQNKNQRLSATASPDNSSQTGADELGRIKNQLDKTITALVRIVQKVEYFEIDKDRKTIVDKSRFDKELVDKGLLKPFFEHLANFPKLSHEVDL